MVLVLFFISLVLRPQWALAGSAKFWLGQVVLRKPQVHRVREEHPQSLGALKFTA
jgi:hypothetical protein